MSRGRSKHQDTRKKRYGAQQRQLAQDGHLRDKTARRARRIVVPEDGLYRYNTGTGELTRLPDPEPPAEEEA